MKKHRKIFYVSGMISVLFTAPLFWYFSKPTLEQNEISNHRIICQMNNIILGFSVIIIFSI